MKQTLTAHLQDNGDVYRLTLGDDSREVLNCELNANTEGGDFFDKATAVASALFDNTALENLALGAHYNESQNLIAWDVEADNLRPVFLAWAEYQGHPDTLEARAIFDSDYQGELDPETYAEDYLVVNFGRNIGWLLGYIDLKALGVDLLDGLFEFEGHYVYV